MKSYTYAGPHDLGQFGIELLGGGTCATGERVRCDLTERGRLVVSKTLGLPDYAEFAGNVTAGDPSDPYVASFMMPHGLAKGLAIIGMFEAHGCNTVLVFQSDAEWAVLRELEGLRLESGEDQSVLADYVAKCYTEPTTYVTARHIFGYDRAIMPPAPSQVELRDVQYAAYAVPGSPNYGGRFNPPSDHLILE